MLLYMQAGVTTNRTTYLTLMQNTFKIQSFENQVVLTWEEDTLLATASRRLLELRKRYPHLVFKIIPHKQVVGNYN